MTAQLEGEPLAALVRRLNTLHARRDLPAVLAAGQELLTALFDGDSSLAQARSTEQSAAFRRLSRHPHLAMSHTWLYRALHIAVQAQALPADVSPHLGISHHRELLVIGDPSARADLARRSVREGWSAEQLRAQVRTMRPVRTRTRVNPAFHRAGGQVRVAVERLAEEEADLIERLGADGVRRLVGELVRQADVLRALGDRLLASVRTREGLTVGRRS